MRNVMSVSFGAMIAALGMVVALCGCVASSPEPTGESLNPSGADGASSEESLQMQSAQDPPRSYDEVVFQVRNGTSESAMAYMAAHYLAEGSVEKVGVRAPRSNDAALPGI